MKRLDDADFAHIVRIAPLISIDLVLHDPDRRVFVGRRTNEPAMGFVFAPGGVVRKNEKIACAFERVLAAETGLAVPRSAAQLLGVYEHFHPTNRFHDPSFDTHYVVLAYELR